MPLQRSPRLAVGRDGLHMNVGIASNPAAESSVDQQNRRLAQPSRPTVARCMTASFVRFVLYSSGPAAICL